VTDSDYVSLISDIFQGYTELSFRGSSVFLRHINLRDQDFLSRQTKKSIESLVQQGMVSEAVRLEELKKSKEWTDNDDLEISELQNFISNLHKTKKKVVLPSQQREIQAEIDREEKKLLELKNKKAQLIDITAELFAARSTNEEFLRHLLYKTPDLKTLAFSEEEFGAIERDELSALFLEYQVVMARFADEVIQEAVLQDCFQGYRMFCDKPWDFYGKPVIQFTVFQQRLIIWGRVFQSIFDNVDKIPDSIKKNPRELLDFADHSRNKEKINKTNKKGEGGASFVVGTRQDAETMADNGMEVGDLAAELKANGGFMSQEDLLKKFGLT